MHYVIWGIAGWLCFNVLMVLWLDKRGRARERWEKFNGPVG